ncbi:MAG: DHH family phosphoesterase [Candidatus Diapherotrites archaeon]
MNYKEKLKELAEKIKKQDDFVVVHHYDADGCSAGAIMYLALKRLGKKVTKKWVKQLYQENIQEIKGLGKNIIFVDFGSGQLEFLKEAFGNNFFVFDHHEKTNVDHENHFSPFNFGINGGYEISASGISYLFAKELDEKNFDLCVLAIVGATGDMQDYSGKLIGLNAQIVEEGKKYGLVKVENDLRLYGRISRPLTQFLAYTTSPILPELTGKEENCLAFLKDANIEIKDGDKWRTYSDLSFEEKKRLSTALILHLNQFNVPEWKITELFGEVYVFTKEDPKSPLCEAKEYSTLCNACGRHGKAEVAIEVCAGDREEYYKQALALMAQHRKELREGIELVTNNGISEEKQFYYFDAKHQIQESIIGIIAGMLYGSSLIETNKPIIAIVHNSDGTIKISGRATKDLVMKGVNLGKAFRKICKVLGQGAEGGGHAIAAGMKIKENQLNEVLPKINETIKEQLEMPLQSDQK